MRSRPALPLLAALALVAAGSVLLGLSVGSMGFGFGDGEVLRRIRLPRVLAGFFTGASLAVSGALLQNLTRNPLADPYVLGVSGGASVGALAVLALGATWGAEGPQPQWLALGAAVGAALATLLLVVCAWRLEARRGAASSLDASVTLLLVGVMIGSGATAIVSLLLSMAPDLQLRGMVFWMLGDLNGVTQWWPCAAGLVAAFALTWPWAHELELMARGEAWALTVGVPVPRRRYQVLAASALATGAAVAAAGAIGFIGLVVPHALRLLGLRRAPVLLPATALVGGAVVVLADTVGRTAMAPTQIPVGVLCALVGAPAFLFLLLRRGPNQRGS